jgi:hypothetical protein
LLQVQLFSEDIFNAVGVFSQLTPTKHPLVLAARTMIPETIRILVGAFLL